MLEYMYTPVLVHIRVYNIIFYMDISLNYLSISNLIYY